MNEEEKERLNEIFKIIKDSCGNDVEIDPTLGAAENKCRNANLDILFGFQDTDPFFFTIISELMANAVSGTISSMSLNALGNWIQLISAAISAYNAQQEYHQGGPGRYYHPIYKNVTNPMCRNEFETDGKAEIRKGKGRKGKTAREKKSSSDEKRLLNLIEDLNKEIDELKDEVKSLQSQIDMLNGKM